MCYLLAKSCIFKACGGVYIYNKNYIYIMYTIYIIKYNTYNKEPSYLIPILDLIFSSI